MTTQPVVYRVGSLVPATVSQSAELRPEQLEEIPYPFGESVGSSPGDTWPPGGFTGVNMTSTSSSTDNTTSNLPEPYNIEWVQGDTAKFQWLFTDVLWTDTDPGITDPLAPVWVETLWAAQVRNPYIYSTYASDFWVPAYGYQYQWWRGHSIVANFTVTAEAIQMATTDPDPPRWGTKVTQLLDAVDSSAILPGNWYRWDLQTRQAGDPSEHPGQGNLDDVVTTHLRGRTRVITEWTVA